MGLQQDNERLSRASLWVCALSLFWCLAAAITSNSLTLIADAQSAALDLASAALAYLSFRMQRGTYRSLLEYGVGKLETLATLFIGLLTGLGASFIMYEAVQMLAHPQPMQGIGIWMGLIGCGVIGIACGRLWWQFRHQLRRSRSPLIATQLRVQAIACWTAVGVAVPLVCTLAFDASWVRYVDIAISLVIGLFTASVGWKMIRHSLSDVIDQSLGEPLQAIINQHLVTHFETYGMFNKVRSRTSGADVFIEIFLSFDPHTSIGDIQQVLDGIKDGIESDISGSHVLVIATAIK